MLKHVVVIVHLDQITKENQSTSVTICLVQSSVPTFIYLISLITLLSPINVGEDNQTEQQWSVSRCPTHDPWSPCNVISNDTGIRRGGAAVGVCMSIRQVGEGFSLLAGRCHDNHESLMQTPPLPESSSPLLSLSALLRMSGKCYYLCPKDQKWRHRTGKRACFLNPNAHLMWIYKTSVVARGLLSRRGSPSQVH